MNPTPKLAFTVESNYLVNGNVVFGASHYNEFPVRVSFPVAQGRFQPGDRLKIVDLQGTALPACIRPFHLWPDGSVRVWEAWMPVSLQRGESVGCELRPTNAASTVPPPIEREGPLSSPSKFTITATLGDGSVLTTEVIFDDDRDADGASVRNDERDFELVSAGTTVFKGTLLRKRWNWYAGMELAIRIINYLPGEELAVQALTLQFDLPGREADRYIVRHAASAGAFPPRLYESKRPFEVRADGGGTHVTEIEQVGRAMTDYALYERGPYAAAVAPWIAGAGNDATWLLVVPEAAERQPKGWSMDGRQVTVELHPAWDEPLSWRRGMALYQRVNLTRLAPGSSPEACENEAMCWLRPPVWTVDAEVYRAAGWRIPFVYQPERFPRTELIVRDTWEFSWTTGTFDWGDQVGGNKSSLPLPPGVPKSRGLGRNLEYDFVACAAKEFARTGRTELWKQCRAAAEHMMHTDFVAVSDDPWQEGGIPHHSIAHTSGAAYPSHMWVEGLTLYYQLSGDPYALRVALRVGDFYLKYIDERFWVVQGTAREMGWTLIALAAIHDMTREERYLRGIRKIVDHYLEAGAANFFPGETSFTIGIAAIGLDRVGGCHRDAEVREFILAILDILLETRVDGIGVFDYYYDTERKGFTYVQTHLPEALNIAYKLTGDAKYLKAAWRLFQIHQAGIPLTVQNRNQTDCGYAAGYHITWTMGCLASFAERGWLDKLQFDDPEPAA